MYTVGIDEVDSTSYIYAESRTKRKRVREMYTYRKWDWGPGG